MKTDEIIEHLEEGVLVLDRNRRILCRSRLLWPRFGLDESEDSLDGAVGEDRLAAWSALVDRAQEERTFRTELEAPNGRRVRVFASARQDGATVVSLREPEPRVEERGVLRAYEQVLAKHGIGLWRIDMTTGELWWSSRCYEMLGLARGPVSTAAYLERLSEEDQAVIGEHIQREVAGTGEYLPCFQVAHAEGTRHFQDRAQLLARDEEGKGQVYVGATVERTRLVELEERCEALEARLAEAEARRSAGQLAGAVAHDLNNVMTVVLGNSELLHSRVHGEEGARLLADVDRAARHAATLAARMLDFVRERPLSLRNLDLHAFVAGSLDFLRSLVAETVTIEFRRATEDVFVLGDRIRLEQALYNLILNAGQATAPTGGRITIEVDSSPSKAVLRVSDEGRGMAPEDRERVFEPFFSTRVGGAGLGLCSVRQIVKQHGGRISASSEPGQGACFEVRLPRVAPGAAAGEPCRSIESPRRLTVWIAEDDNMVRVVLERLLIGADHDVRAFARPADLLGALVGGGEPPDLLITDVILPEMSGPELHRAVRSREPAVGVLFISGYADRVLDSFRDELAHAPLLHKPFARDELLRAVREAVPDPCRLDEQPS